MSHDLLDINRVTSGLVKFRGTVQDHEGRLFDHASQTRFARIYVQYEDLALMLHGVGVTTSVWGFQVFYIDFLEF